MPLFRSYPREARSKHASGSVELVIGPFEKPCVVLNAFFTSDAAVVEDPELLYAEYTDPADADYNGIVAEVETAGLSSAMLDFGNHGLYLKVGAILTISHDNTDGNAVAIRASYENLL